jgi:NDP-sugar pyrophosphorylase family protein
MGVEAIILAGGRGSRLKSVISDVPKPLAPIAGRPFLDHLIDRLADSGVVDRLVLTLGHLAGRAIAHFEAHPPRLPMKIVVEASELGTGGALVAAVPALHGETFLVLNGDTLLALDYAALLAAHAEARAEATLALVEVADASRFGTVELRGTRVIGFAEKQPGFGLINGGVYVFERHAFDTVAPGGASLERDLLPALIDRGRVAAFPTRAPFIDIGLPETYAAAEAFLAGLQPGR